MRLPSCHVDHPENEILSAAGAIQAGRRKTHGAGTGRPRSKSRCACGLMTAARAVARKHACGKIAKAL
jgi:hypothetical protein